MMGKVQERKAKLHDRLIDVAEAQIIEGGLSTVKARDLARKAECALGAIYNVFDDINDLLMAVNGRTFHKLGEAVSAAVKDAHDEGPNDQLIAMSKAYLGFAAENTHLWRALFDLEMSSESKVPEWYLAELAQLFTHIAHPLARLFPDLPRDELDLMVRALFSSVHGIVLLGLEKRISGVPRPQIEHMIAQVLSQIGK
ncbi:WHG domain-containing protein [Pseudosulfitobacter sp. SM2401]|uniref:TetR/AcrR family transcriptional regulator n=1 Tax=Pseudosulfitobacter sp. SM2401 TaxID=3350098 RepID=UPI0036F2C011